MDKNKKLVLNTALLTSSGLVMRCIALAFQVWLTGRIGASGIGLFQLVMSVQFLAATFAISGIRFAATRLISEEFGHSRPGGVRRVVRLCLGYSLFFGVAALLILLLVAKPVGFLWIGDARTVLSLRLVALSMPFIGMSSVFSGYFTSSGRVWKGAFAQIAEQLVRILLVSVFLGLAPEQDIEQSCAAVVLGGTVAELFSFLLHLFLYLTDIHRHLDRGEHGPRLPTRMLGVAVPLALSAYARSALSTLQHLLVPRGLKASGLSADAALAGYGVVHGMVLPIVTFPLCLLMALADLLVPTLTEAQVSGNPDQIAGTVNGLIEKCLLFAVGVAALLFSNAELLGMSIYGSEEAGRYIRIFACFVPIMYLDTVTDGCLKGLGEQLWSMVVNIADSAVSVLLVILLLPKYALAGYIFMICFTEVFNFALSAYRLRKVATLRVAPRAFLLPLLCALGGVNAAALLLRPFPISGTPLCVFSILSGALIYALLLWLCGAFRSKPRLRHAG